MMRRHDRRDQKMLDVESFEFYGNSSPHMLRNVYGQRIDKNKWSIETEERDTESREHFTCETELEARPVAEESSWESTQDGATKL